MNPSYLKELEESLHNLKGAALPMPDSRGMIGIVVSDPLHRRLIESASTQLELTPRVLRVDALTEEDLGSCEMIVADEEMALEIRLRFGEQEERGEGVHPAVIGVVKRTAEQSAVVDSGDVPSADGRFDGVLALPMTPALTAAQMSLLLYSHRAFARRYQSALEELNLNRRIFRSVTSGISVANAMMPDLPLVYVNPAFEVMTGYSLEDVLGKNCRFLQGKELDQPAHTVIRQALKEEREVTTILKNFHKNGSFFWNELSLSPIRNRDGQLTHFVGIQTDVTARVEFEAALRQSEKLAAVGRLASSIAHEINNPLEAIINLIYLAERTECSPETLEYLALADKELQRVKLITSQSLRFYKQSTKPQAVRTGELIASVLGLYQARLHNSAVFVEQRERSERTIVCMESEIRQVLHNLVSNAIDAMHGRGGRLLIRSRDVQGGRSGVDGVMITVADSGMGMSRETREEIYKAFYTTKDIGGTGLGLWISSEIVERHRGSLSVRSKVGQGTVFELFLPVEGVAG